MNKTRCIRRFLMVLYSGLLVSFAAACLDGMALADKPEAPTREFLDKLKEQNGEGQRFKDPWLQTLKEIVDLGPDAVPELIVELDATNDNMMMRCLGFILRAIGDKRAVPALIRAIPKTLIPPGSDMGLTANDPELLKFGQENDLDPVDRDGQYVFGRPVREIFGALQKLTGEDQSDQELYSIFLDGLPSQQQLKRELFQRRAIGWAEWWEANWSDHVQDKAYSKVDLVIPEDPGGIEQPSLDGRFKTNSGNSNWILESIHNPKAKRVFYDLDIGRVGRLPKKWRDEKNLENQFDQIMLWAMREGFDLMGTEYETADKKKVFALRSLGMQVWELGPERWKADLQDVSLDELKEEGQSADKLLLHRDETSGAIDPRLHTTFLFITRHRTPGLLFVGIEVQDDSLKPGGVHQGDDELRPIHFTKGRRFAYKILE